MRFCKETFSRGSTVVEWIRRLRVDREVRGSNLGAGETFFVNHSRIVKMDGWMRARDLARARVADSQDWLFECDREKDRFFTLLLNTDTITSDFEEHLALGVGKNASSALKFGLWLCIVKKKDLKRKRRKGNRKGWLIL